MGANGQEYNSAKRRVGFLIRKFRKASGMSQRALSEMIGVSYQQVQKYEYGTSEISVAMLEKIAGAMRMPVGAFMGGAGAGEGYPLDEARVVALYRELKVRDLGAAAVEILGILARIDAGSKHSRGS